MERNERLVLEIITGAVFIVILILSSIIVINASEGSETTVTNSYNTYYYDGYSATGSVLAYNTNSKPYIVDSGYVYSDYNENYFNDNLYKGKTSLIFHDGSRLVKTKSIIGTDINNYEVYVRNREYTGGYFKVTYFFHDHYGQKKSYSITHYVPAKEQKKFLFKDISPSNHKYRFWDYEIESLSKKPAKVYYN